MKRRHAWRTVWMLDKEPIVVVGIFLILLALLGVMAGCVIKEPIAVGVFAPAESSRGSVPTVQPVPVVEEDYYYPIPRY